MLLLLTAINELRDDKAKPLPDVIGRVPDRLCLAQSEVKDDAVILTYKTVTKPTGLFVPRLFRLVGDAGLILEATAASNEPNQIVLVRHTIGRLAAYGLFAGIPSGAQLERVFERDDSVPMIGNAVLKPEGGSDIHLDCSQFLEGCGKAAPSAQPPATSSR
jgi:hypothetical protein